jgi:transposase InsO family protein
MSNSRLRLRTTSSKAEAQLRCKTRKRFRPAADSTPLARVAPNILARQFKVTAPSRIYVGDITYIPTSQGWVYLAVAIDLFSRAVVGWAMTEHRRASLVNQALMMAIKRRRPRPPPGLVMHTDLIDG